MAENLPDGLEDELEIVLQQFAEEYGVSMETAAQGTPLEEKYTS